MNIQDNPSKLNAIDLLIQELKSKVEGGLFRLILSKEEGGGACMDR